MEFRKKLRAMTNEGSGTPARQEKSTEPAKPKSTDVSLADPIDGSSKDMTAATPKERIDTNENLEGKLVPKPASAGSADKSQGLVNGSGTSAKPQNLPPAGAKTHSGTKVGTVIAPTISGADATSLRMTENQGLGSATAVVNDTTSSESKLPSNSPIKAFAGAPGPTRGTIQSDATPAVSGGASTEPHAMHTRTRSQGNGLWDGKPIELKPEGSPKIELKSDDLAKTEIPGSYGNAPPRVPELTHMQKRNDTNSKYTTPPQTPQHRPPTVARASSTPLQPAKSSTSLDGFDPLRPRAVSAMGSEGHPVMSFATKVSGVAVPFGSTSSSYFQHQSGHGVFPTTSGLLASGSQYVFPIAFGMSPIETTNTEQPMGTGYHAPQPYLIHPPIMLQGVPGDMHSWPIAGQQPPAAPCYQQTDELKQAQHDTPSPAPMNPFDPFGG